MKKLSLKNLKLEASDMLQRNQLKAVYGGYSSNGLCQDDCQTDEDCPLEDSYCTVYNVSLHCRNAETVKWCSNPGW